MQLVLKRVFLTFIILLILIVAGAYLFIPPTITIKYTAKIDCNTIAAARTIHNDWKKIVALHLNVKSDNSSNTYTFRQPIYNGNLIDININDRLYPSVLTFVSLSSDSSLIEWETKIKTGNNPVKKIYSYFQVKLLETSIYKEAKIIQTFLSKSENVYGYRIIHTTLTDTLVAFVRKRMETPPSITDIYTIANEIKRSVRKKGAKETNYTMLNVICTDSGYSVNVGLPINKVIPETKNISIKRLSPIQNKILSTEVRGGIKTVQDAYKQIELYMQDRSITAPVMPFEYLITDRNKELDTAKWITKIYYPII